MRIAWIGVLVGCSATNAPTGEPTTVTVTSGSPLLVAAFRDGPHAPWRDATMTGPNTYEIVVHGSYVFGGVYDNGIDPVHLYELVQFARTLDDELAFTVNEPQLAEPSTLGGRIVQPGTLSVGEVIVGASTPNWDFEVPISAGVHDLFVVSADHAFVQHGLDTTHDVALGTLDVAAQGVAFDTVAFTAANLGPTETPKSATMIETPTTSLVRIGSQGEPGATRMVPDAALVETDVQSVSVRGYDGGHFRAVRMPFHPGLSTAYTLPSLLGPVSWTGSHDPTVHWASLVPSDFSATVSDASRGYVLVMSRHYVETAGVMEFTFDTGLPGFDDAWRVDLGGEVSHSATAQLVHGVGTVETDERDDPDPAGARVAPRAARWHHATRVEP